MSSSSGWANTATRVLGSAACVMGPSPSTSKDQRNAENLATALPSRGVHLTPALTCGLRRARLPNRRSCMQQYSIRRRWPHHFTTLRLTDVMRRPVWRTTLHENEAQRPRPLVAMAGQSVAQPPPTGDRMEVEAWPVVALHPV